MRVLLLVSTLLVASLAPAAYAQMGSSSSSSGQSAAQANQQQQSLPAQIKSKLTQDGFTDVTVMPGSFVVSAKDKNGDPVTMILGPNSMTVLTAVMPQNQQRTTGSGSPSGSMGSGSSSGSMGPNSNSNNQNMGTGTGGRK